MDSKSFRGSLGPWDVIETEDGSKTLYSQYFEENCHSTVGARAETIFQYIHGCNIRSKNPPKILEIGFGAGVGFEETYKYLSKLKIPFHFVSLEMDSKLPFWFIENNELNIETKFNLNENHFELIHDHFQLDILIGDARKTVLNWIKDKDFLNYFNCIYQDPFSPKKNPRLWTSEWFNNLYQISSEDVELSSYCSSIGFRKALIETGWIVSEGGSFGRKRSSTRAKKKGENEEDILNILTHSKIESFKD